MSSTAECVMHQVETFFPNASDTSTLQVVHQATKYNVCQMPDLGNGATCSQQTLVTQRVTEDCWIAHRPMPETSRSKVAQCHPNQATKGHVIHKCKAILKSNSGSMPSQPCREDAPGALRVPMRVESHPCVVRELLKQRL